MFYQQFHEVHSVSRNGVGERTVFDSDLAFIPSQQFD
jgi:hypothetical protein